VWRWRGAVGDEPSSEPNRQRGSADGLCESLRRATAVALCSKSAARSGWGTQCRGTAAYNRRRSVGQNLAANKAGPSHEGNVSANTRVIRGLLIFADLKSAPQTPHIVIIHFNTWHIKDFFVVWWKLAISLFLASLTALRKEDYLGSAISRFAETGSVRQLYGHCRRIFLCRDVRGYLL
jgi:hypothetical protein